MTTKKKTIRKKKYTLKEFQAWLTGIEEIQPDEWHPDLDQWRLIRERMNGIVADVEIIEREIEVVKQVPVPVTPHFVPQPTHMVTPPAGTAVVTPPPAPAPPAPPPPLHDISPAAAAALRGEMPADSVTSGQPTHKLPADPTVGTDAPGTTYESTFI